MTKDESISSFFSVTLPRRIRVNARYWFITARKKMAPLYIFLGLFYFGPIAGMITTDLISDKAVNSGYFIAAWTAPFTVVILIFLLVPIKEE